MSRSLSDLEPYFKFQAFRVIEEAHKAGLNMLIYCTYRSPEEQARLYRRGRLYAEIKDMADKLETKWKRPDLSETLMGVGPQRGRQVTHSAPGQSLHNYKLAFDAVPIRNGKPVWETQDKDDLLLWKQYGNIVESTGLEWGGNWSSFKDYSHAQQISVNWRDLIVNKS